MRWRISWAVVLVALASACNDPRTVGQLERVQRRLGDRIEERKSHLAKGEYARWEQDLLREKLGEVRHVSTRDALLAQVAALPDGVRVEVLEEKPDALRVRFSGASVRTRPQGVGEVLRFSFLELTSFQGDDSQWSAEGMLYLSQPCEHSSWDEEPLTEGLADPGLLEGRQTRRLRGEIARGLQELASLDAQLKARGAGELGRLQRCAEGMLFRLEPIQRASLVDLQSALWETFVPSARGRLWQEGETIIFQGHFPGDSRGLPWMRWQRAGEWTWEDRSLLHEDYELIEFNPADGLLKVRRRVGTR